MRLRNEDGGAIIEFAIILPLVLIVVFGICEFGILLFDKAVITNASREGARAGIVFNFDPALPNPRTSNAEIIRIVRTYAEPYVRNLGGSSVVQVPPPIWSGTEAGDTLTVTVNYQYQFLVLSKLIALFDDDFANGVPLSAVTVMRLE